MTEEILFPDEPDEQFPKEKQLPEVLQFRSPQQKSITEGIYQAYLTHHQITEEDPDNTKTLLYDVTDRKGPFIYQLDAPTGWGKSIVAMEPLRWISSALTQKYGDRWQPKNKDEFLDAVASIRNNLDPEFLKDHHPLLSELKKYDPDSKKLPPSVSSGAVAAFVRTRSQTQAFLREASRQKLNAIALPSKASACLNGKVNIDVSENVDDLSFDGLPNLKEANSMLVKITSSSDGDNPIAKKAPYDPGAHPYMARLHSRVCDQCSRCPLNINLVKRQVRKLREEGGRTEGSKLDSLNIHLSTGIPSVEEYMRAVVKAQSKHMDLEESSKELWAQYPNVCPYPIIRNSLPDFDFIILTYPYLFNPEISEIMQEYLGHVHHAIIDEAHNIDILYQQMSKLVYLGESYSESINQSLFNFDILEHDKIEELEKSLTEGLFKSEYEHKLNLALNKANMEYGDGFSEEFYNKKALSYMASAGDVDPQAVIDLYTEMKESIQFMSMWVAAVQHRYVEYYHNLIATVGENNVSKGVAPEFKDLIHLVFGDFNLLPEILESDSNKNRKKGTSEQSFMLFLANSKVMLKKRHQLNNFSLIAKHVKRLNGFKYRPLVESGKASGNKTIKTIIRQTESAVNDLKDYVYSILNLNFVLVCNHPTEMATWMLDKKINSNDFEYLFINSNILIQNETDRVSMKEYYLNGQYNWSEFAHNQDYTLIDDPVIPTILHTLKEKKRPAEKDIETLKDVLEEHALEIPVYRYKQEFPYSNWKIYYRYWDDYFEIIPLTLGKLLANQFSEYVTIGMLSGTFPGRQYVQAFWGLNTYEFKVTETVGVCNKYNIDGLTTKYNSRGPRTWKQYAELIETVFEKDTEKNMLVAFASGKIMSEVMKEFSPSNYHHWPPQHRIGRVQVNDMIEELRMSSLRGERKIYCVAQGSRFTEGVEYVGADGKSLLDSVLIAGIQYAPPDIVIDDRKQHVKVLFGVNDWEAFQIIDFQMAWQKIRQALGRGIRSDSDQINVYLADSRFSANYWQKVLPCKATIHIRNILR